MLRQRLQSLIVLGDHVLVAAKVLLRTRPIVVGRHLHRILMVVVTVDWLRERRSGLVERGNDGLRASAAVISIESRVVNHNHLLRVVILVCTAHLIDCGRSVHLVGVFGKGLFNRRLINRDVLLTVHVMASQHVLLVGRIRLHGSLLLVGLSTLITLFLKRLLLFLGVARLSFRYCVALAELFRALN